ncbi:DUF4352 domain-containing protein [Carboxydocella sp. ULO1]|uniref:DUF4352 domain-containing protein n=1 Tax=Carboxydocella sp. ULO1 TaxID=1926599 RepID=UPI0009AD59DD|nr:DUF4352 domain-containing protein [Carboxydocella sp. ULO1]GAW28948.1 DUF4352 domain-containing protein [Carboxydocella sp. ULO1]
MKKTLATIILLIGLLSGCGQTITPEKVEQQPGNAQNQSTQAPIKNEPKYFKVGEKVKMGDLAITVNSVKKSNGTQLFKPESGNIFIIIDAAIENLGNESAALSSLMMFKLADSEGYSYNQTILDNVKGSLDGEVGPGRKMRGEIVYEVPKKAQGLEFIFEPNLLGFGQAIFKLQ